MANPFKERLLAGRQQYGIWCSLPGPLTAELLATCGYDWVCVDTEHTAVTLPDVMTMLQAIAPHPTQAVVRPGLLDVVEIKRLLDIGAQTLLVPYVQSAEEAARAVAAVRYPPEGIRGVSGLTRASRFGLTQGYAANANRDICLLIQAETVTALEQLEEMAAVPGVDGIFIGPADLAASMGLVGQPTHPEVRKAVADGIPRIRAAGKAPGVLSVDQGVVAECVAAGSLFTAVDIDMAILLRGARARAAEWRALG